MNIKPRYGAKWLRKKTAITLWPFVFFGSEIEDVSNHLKIHESVHWGHQNKFKWAWPFTYGIAYVALAIRHWSTNSKHPMEKEAYITGDKYLYADVKTQREYLQNHNWPIHKETYGDQ